MRKSIPHPRRRAPGSASLRETDTTMRHPHICPRCGEPVSAFAAGCALCGADLDPRRARRPKSAAQRLRSSWRARPRLLPRIGIPERRR